MYCPLETDAFALRFCDKYLVEDLGLIRGLFPDFF